MGRSVGAQAARAVAAGKTKAAKAEVTTERAIAEIRALRASSLHVGNDEYIDKLLAAYDETIMLLAVKDLALQLGASEEKVNNIRLSECGGAESEEPCTTV